MAVAKRPADRYGRKKSRIPARWRYLAGLSVLAIAVGLFTIFAYRNLAGQPIDAEQTGFRVINPQSVRIQFTVTRDEPRRAADCIIRARSASGEETGRREVYVPPGPGTTTVTAALQTAEEAVTGEVYGCTYDIPPYLSTESPPSG